jgi:glycosyltransferase involved in cell wall biosynthesis
VSELRLSVVIPARNEEQLLGACLAALRNQSEPVDEIIVVDNGSADRTVDIARSHPGVRLLAEAVPGVTYARDTGLDAADGDILARIDADTVVTPGWAAAIRRAFAADPGLGGLGGPAGITRLSDGDRIAGLTIYRLFRVIHQVTIGDGPLVYGHNMAIRSRAWGDIRDLVTAGDHRISEDVDIALALLHTGWSVAYDPGMLVTIALERTLKLRKLRGYRRADRLTKAKYRRLRRGQPQHALE